MVPPITHLQIAEKCAYREGPTCVVSFDLMTLTPQQSCITSPNELSAETF